jgi:hypothetical protein
MLFMVIEHFRNQDPRPIGERFTLKGRMLPDGVVYISSWIDPAQVRCFQVMEAPSIDALHAWTAHWDDLADFEIIQVVTSQEYWANPALSKDIADRTSKAGQQ